MRLIRPVQARFHYGYPPPVNLATHRNSQAHSSKGTQSHHVPGGTTLLRLVSTRFQVLFHDPSPGCFSPFPHGTSPLSVTREYSGLGGGPPRFTRNSTGSVLLGNTPRKPQGFHLRDCHPLRPDFPDCSATPAVYHFLPARQYRAGGPTTPHAQRLPAVTRMRFSLFPVRSPLLGESRLLSLPAGTEMFHFPALPPAALCIQAGATAHNGRQVSPFGNPRITAWLPAPRGISQAPASFIGSWYQGIHRVPLKTWHNKNTANTQRNPPPPPGKRELQVLDARVHCAVLKKRTAPQAPAPAGATASGPY
jgi:hypothetical protein